MDKNKETAQREVLTIQRCRRYVVLHLGAVLLFSLMGLYVLHMQNVWLALLQAFTAAFFVFASVVHWKQYVAVKNGAVIYTRRIAPTKAPSLDAPLLFSVAMVFLLTVMVILFSGTCLWLWHISSPRQRHDLGVWSVLAVLSGIVWIFTVFCWRRLLLTRRQAKPTPEPQEQEGVWPPPPKYGNAD
ncbi:MAG: hypothetical protein JO250_05965 [Armatimonadetes bacterium]|nr:hypothetical protein [Armatimonadota bacterium]